MQAHHATIQTDGPSPPHVCTPTKPKPGSQLLVRMCKLLRIYFMLITNLGLFINVIPSYFLPVTAATVCNCCEWWYFLENTGEIIITKSKLFSHGIPTRGRILGRPQYQAHSGRGWTTTGITLMPPSLLWGTGLMCRCRTDTLLEWGRCFFFSLCNRLLWTLGSYIVFIALPVQNVGLFHALKKRFWPRTHAHIKKRNHKMLSLLQY